MNYHATHILSVSLLATLMTACGGGGGSSDNGTSGGGGSSSKLAGGQLAQDYADQTAASTHALSGITPGDPIPLDEGGGGDDGIAPAPPSVGADVPITYFGPAPSSVNPRLVGPLKLLKAGTVNLDGKVPTVTLPLYEGRLESGGPQNGARFWYVVTDTSDKENAAALGLNFSSKLLFADIPSGMRETIMSTSIRNGYYDTNGVLTVSGGPVYFAQERVVSSPSTDASGTNNLLTQLSFQPGAVGAGNGDPDGFYSPLVRISNAGGHIYNAPTVSFGTSREALNAYCDGIPEGQMGEARKILHDKVVAICPGENGEPGTVTLELTQGFSFGRPVLYVSTDTSADIAATLENAIYAPALANIPVGRDDSLFSGVERIFGFTNGPYNEFDEVNPQRQGFNSAIRGEGGPLNVLGGIPTIATDYSPLWDLNLGEWTQEAVDNGYRSRMTEEFSILGMVERGFVTGPGGTPYGSSGIIVNCPIVQRLL